MSMSTKRPRQSFPFVKCHGESHQRRSLKFLKAINGEDSVVFSSDWPHHDFDHPNKVLQIPVSDEVRRKILGKNALRLLNVDGAQR
jgi:predicted TIM-barrel fold metal-dependent hydrolase